MRRLGGDYGSEGSSLEPSLPACGVKGGGKVGNAVALEGIGEGVQL
jgi:hypothetical protein